MYIGIYIISAFFMVIGMVVSGRLKSKIQKYSQMPTTSGMSGAEVAAKMLYDSNISDVKIVQGQGFLTDHYNPITKTVSLSPNVFNGRHVAAAAVAAHECGHAVQHAKEYAFLQMRSKLVPVVQLGSRLNQFIILAGLILTGVSGLQGIGMNIFLIGIGLFSLTTLFAVVTLPVEFDATKRGLAWLDNAGITRPKEHEAAKDALKWAARTYIVAALSSIAYLLYYIMLFIGRRR